MTSPDFNQLVQGVSEKALSTGQPALSFDDPFREIFVLIFVTILIERALTAIYSTGLWELIRKPIKNLGIDGLKLYVAIAVNVWLCFIIHLDAFSLLTGAEASTLGMLITGLFNSGGAKAWADIYNQLHAVRERKVMAAKAFDKEPKR